MKQFIQALCLVLAFSVIVTRGASSAYAQSEEAAEGGEGGKSEEGGEGKSSHKPKFVPLEGAFVTNFVDDRIRYFRTDITLRVNDGDTEDAIRKHEFAVRHSLVMLFSRQTEENLMSIEGREQLQQEAITEVTNVLASENAASNLQNVLFTTFVVE